MLLCKQNDIQQKNDIYFAYTCSIGSHIIILLGVYMGNLGGDGETDKKEGPQRRTCLWTS